MNLKQIQELIKFVAKSGATEVDLEMGDVKICIKSPPKGKMITELPVIAPAPTQIVPPQNPYIPSSPPAQVQLTQNKEISSDTNIPEVSSDNYLEIKSPIIGTFYRRPSPDKDPFINVGDKIDVGSVVGIVEAMKLFNEIESEITGTVVKVLVDDMSPVEYDQPLFLVDPN